MKIAAVIPAYNEEKSIVAVVDSINTLRIQGIDITAIVVNDCSKDNTAAVASKADCILLNLPVNLGIGGAVQTGFKFALRNHFDIAIQVDGDGQHPANEIPNLIAPIINNLADVVIGSRFIEKTGFQSSSLRRGGIKYFKYVHRLLVNVQFTDSTSGFRALNKKALTIVDEYYPDEYPEPEAIVLYAFNDLKILEIPVEMRERQGGVSSINTLSGIYYMIKVTLAIIFTYIRLKRNK
ncbi:MAG: glycosyltransferase family 2 protein [Bacteroidota bacterium]